MSPNATYSIKPNVDDLFPSEAGVIEILEPRPFYKRSLFIAVVSLCVLVGAFILGLSVFGESTKRPLAQTQFLDLGKTPTVLNNSAKPTDEYTRLEKTKKPYSSRTVPRYKLHILVAVLALLVLLFLAVYLTVLRKNSVPVVNSTNISKPEDANNQIVNISQPVKNTAKTNASLTANLTTEEPSKQISSEPETVFVWWKWVAGAVGVVFFAACAVYYQMYYKFPLTVYRNGAFEKLKFAPGATVESLQTKLDSNYGPGHVITVRGEVLDKDVPLVTLSKEHVEATLEELFDPERYHLSDTFVGGCLISRTEKMANVRFKFMDTKGTPNFSRMPLPLSYTRDDITSYVKKHNANLKDHNLTITVTFDSVEVKVDHPLARAFEHKSYNERYVDNFPHKDIEVHVSTKGSKPKCKSISGIEVFFFQILNADGPKRVFPTGNLMMNRQEFRMAVENSNVSLPVDHAEREIVFVYAGKRLNGFLPIMDVTGEIQKMTGIIILFDPKPGLEDSSHLVDVQVEFLDPAHSSTVKLEQLPLDATMPELAVIILERYPFGNTVTLSVVYDGVMVDPVHYTKPLHRAFAHKWHNEHLEAASSNRPVQICVSFSNVQYKELAPGLCNTPSGKKTLQLCANIHEVEANVKFEIPGNDVKSVEVLGQNNIPSLSYLPLIMSDPAVIPTVQFTT